MKETQHRVDLTVPVAQVPHRTLTKVARTRTTRVVVELVVPTITEAATTVAKITTTKVVGTTSLATIETSNDLAFCN